MHWGEGRNARKVFAKFRLFGACIEITTVVGNGCLYGFLDAGKNGWQNAVGTTLHFPVAETFAFLSPPPFWQIISFACVQKRRGEISRPPLKSSWNEAEKILSPPPPFSHIPFRPGKQGEFPLFCLPACMGGEGDAFVMRPVLIPPPLFYLPKKRKKYLGKRLRRKRNLWSD